MARARNPRDGRLEKAMANMARSQEHLLQAQTLLLGQLADSNRRIDETNRRIEETGHRLDERFARIDERFARIDERFERIEAILVQHGQILNELIRLVETLPEAICRQIGGKSSGRAVAHRLIRRRFRARSSGPARPFPASGS